ncbi:MAG: shikimate dehydrogenase [Patescibacteria group bacterium]
MSKKFGILAHPAGHSLSPAMHRAAFQKLGIDATYDFFDIPPENLAEFFAKEVRTKKISGLSVSIPHKEKVIPLLDVVDLSVEEIGAVNTVYWEGDKLVGTNTDWIGFLTALKEKINPIKKKVVIAGGGGAARAIIHALLITPQNCKITIVTREEWEFEGLKKDFGNQIEKYGFIKNLDHFDPEILINATPLGMKGGFEGRSCVEPSFFENHKPLVFDIVYNPRETKLLADAKKAGCETIEGLRMLVNQAIAQFEKFTGRSIDFATMWDSATAELGK